MSYENSQSVSTIRNATLRSCARMSRVRRAHNVDDDRDGEGCRIPEALDLFEVYSSPRSCYREQLRELSRLTISIAASHTAASNVSIRELVCATRCISQDYTFPLYHYPQMYNCVAPLQYCSSQRFPLQLPLGPLLIRATLLERVSKAFVGWQWDGRPCEVLCDLRLKMLPERVRAILSQQCGEFALEIASNRLCSISAQRVSVSAARLSSSYALQPEHQELFRVACRSAEVSAVPTCALLLWRGQYRVCQASGLLYANW